MTLADLAAEYLAALRAERGLAAASVAAYRRDLAQYLAALGRSRPSPEAASRFVQGLHQRGLAPATVARKVAAVRGFHRFLVAEGLAEEDPTVLLDAPRRPATLPKALSVQEVLQLLEAERPRPAQLIDPEGRRRYPALERRYQALAHRDRALVEFMYATGARVAEVVELPKMSLDPPPPEEEELPPTGETEPLEAPATVRLRGKGDRERVVPVGKPAYRVIAEYLLHHRKVLVRPGERPKELFLSRRGRRLSRQGVWRIIRDRAGAAGLNPQLASPHVLRHSAATHMVEGGADLRVVQEFLGHANISTTQVYTRVSAPHLLEVYAVSHPRST